MRFLFAVLLLLACMPVHAATMCVPDLSTCESCTPVGTEENKWVADCCGVRVSGYALMFQMSMFGDGSCANVSQPIDQRFFDFREAFVVACLMISPSVPKYTYLVSSSNIEYQAILQDCASAFKPKCAFSECSEVLCTELGGV